MEIKARYRLMGLFMLAVIGLGFGFVYWLQNAGGLAERKTYQIRFEDTVGGLQVGAPVLFNGIRVGEVTGVKLDADPHVIFATIAIDKTTPLRADTSVSIDFQGLTGSAAVSLKGGSANLPVLNTMANPPPLRARPSAAQGLSDMARQVLGRLDKIFAENSTDLHDTIANFKTFSGALAKNSGRIDTILGGLEKTFAAPPKPVMAVYDLSAPSDFPLLKQAVLQRQLAVADPTTILTFDTQQILIKPQQGPTHAIENAQWGDSLPRLIQEKIIQSFENAHYLGEVTRPIEGLEADNRLLIDLRAFDIAPSPEPHAVIEFTAKILLRNGKLAGARLFHAEAPAKALDAAAAVAAFNEAFDKAATELVTWAAPLVFEGKLPPKGKPVQSELP